MSDRIFFLTRMTFDVVFVDLRRRWLANVALALLAGGNLIGQQSCSSLFCRLLKDTSGTGPITVDSHDREQHHAL